MDKPLEYLKRLALDMNRQKYPTFPDHLRPVPKYSDKDEGGLERCIIHFCEFNGWQAERVKVKPIIKDNRIKYIDAVGRQKTIGSVEYRRSNMTPGSADLSATIKGRSIKIEIKIGKDNQKKPQKEYQADIERAGGIYIIVTSFNDFYTWYNKFITTVTS